MSDAEAQKLAAEGKPFYLIYATIHSTEVCNGQAIINIVHRLATENTPQIRRDSRQLGGADGAVAESRRPAPGDRSLVQDEGHATTTASIPDLYHKYVGHDDNRDWFMFTQKETRMNIELVQNKYKPIITHDMHQQGGNGSRIFVPPFTEPFDPNMHPLLRMGQNTVGQAMASALLAEGKEGVAWEDSYDMWSPARQYMVYHGQPRILTEIANSNLADPVKSAERPAARSAGIARALPGAVLQGHVDARAAGGLRHHRGARRHVARREVRHASGCATSTACTATMSNDNGGPYAFVVPADSARSVRRPTRCSTSCKFGDVEIHKATAPFTANGKQYAAGSWVIKTAQPVRRVSPRRCSRSRSIPTCACSRAVRPSRRMTSPATRCGC